MADSFSEFAVGMTGPAANSAAITPSDSTDLDYVTRAVSADVAGPLRYAPVGTEGDAIVTRFIPAGVQIAIRAKRIYATGTDAEGITADW